MKRANLLTILALTMMSVGLYSLIFTVQAAANVVTVWCSNSISKWLDSRKQRQMDDCGKSRQIIKVFSLSNQERKF